MSNFLDEVKRLAAEVDSVAEQSEDVVLSETRRLTFGDKLITDDMLKDLPDHVLRNSLNDEEYERITGKKSDKNQQQEVVAEEQDIISVPTKPQSKNARKRDRRRRNKQLRAEEQAKNEQSTVEQPAIPIVVDAPSVLESNKPVRKEMNYTAYTVTGLILLLTAILGYFIMFK